MKWTLLLLTILMCSCNATRKMDKRPKGVTISIRQIEQDKVSPEMNFNLVLEISNNTRKACYFPIPTNLVQVDGHRDHPTNPTFFSLQLKEVECFYPSLNESASFKTKDDFVLMPKRSIKTFQINPLHFEGLTCILKEEVQAGIAVKYKPDTDLINKAQSPDWLQQSGIDPELHTILPNLYADSLITSIKKLKYGNSK